MWKFNIPEGEKMYIYFLLAALVLVIIFSWGQLSFFSYNQLRVTSGTAARTQYIPDSGGGSGRYVSSGAIKLAAATNKPSFFPRSHRAWATFLAKRDIRRLQRLEQKAQTDEERALIAAELGDYYSFVLNDDQQASSYYQQAVSLGGTGILSASRKTPGASEGYSFFDVVSVPVVLGSVGAFFANSQPYDARTAGKQLGKSTEERLMNMAADRPPREPLYSDRGDTGPAGDRTEVFTKDDAAGDITYSLYPIVKRMVSAMVQGRPKDIIPYLAMPGVRVGKDTEQELFIDRLAANEQLKQMQGPVYSALFSTVKKYSLTEDDITYTITKTDRRTCLVKVRYQLPGGSKDQDLFFQLKEGLWYLVFLGT